MRCLTICSFYVISSMMMIDYQESFLLRFKVAAFCKLKGKLYFTPKTKALLPFSAHKSYYLVCPLDLRFTLSVNGHPVKRKNENLFFFVTTEAVPAIAGIGFAFPWYRLTISVKAKPCGPPLAGLDRYFQPFFLALFFTNVASNGFGPPCLLHI